MSEPNSSEHALILSLEPSGESYLKLSALSAESGAFLCLKRRSKKNPLKDPPDLFDTADISLETARSGTTRFVKDYRTINRRLAIGNSYKKLLHASEFAKLIANNAPLMSDYPALYKLCEQSLDAFAERSYPEIIHLKSLYRLLYTEGYPVRESWWPKLQDSLKTEARVLLNQPTPETMENTLEESVNDLMQSLQNWLQHETDFKLP